MVLQLKDWSIQRGQEVSLGPLDFSICAGEIVTVMGPSGVGKTTWLMSLLGYEEPGLRLSGQRIQESKVLLPGAVPKQALYIPQHLPFNPNWEVQGFLGRLPWGKPSFGDLLLPLSLRPQRLRRVQAVLEQLGLAHRAKATAAELSGGEIQRAAIAQLLLLSPKLLVGDEFVSALDPGMAIQILEQCREILTQAQGAGIFALHDVQTALKISDRILLMWSPTLTHQPWEIKSDTLAWRGEVLYTLLCLARWSKDFNPSKGFSHLFRYLQTWLQDERALIQFLDQCTETNTVILNDKGNIIPLNQKIEEFPHWDRRSDHWTDMIPLHTVIDQKTYLGLGIPRGKNQDALTVLA